MRTLEWSWPSKIVFVLMGVACGMSAAMAFADERDAVSLCSQSPVPGVLTPYYDQYGRLNRVDDHLNGARAHFLFDENGVLTTVLQNKFVSRLPHPDRHGSTEFRVPTRATDYDRNTGRITRISTYEDAILKPGKYPGGYQTSIEFAADTDFEKLRDKRDGKIRYTGPAKHCTLEYSCKSIGNRSVEINEPLNSKGLKCFEFGGHSVALQLSRAANAEIEAAQQGPKNAAGSRTICIEGGCITVHDDDGSTADSPADGVEELGQSELE